MLCIAADFQCNMRNEAMSVPDQWLGIARVRPESAFNEAGDSLIPIAEGAIDRSRVGEIGAVLLGRISGRTDPKQTTV